MRTGNVATTIAIAIVVVLYLVAAGTCSAQFASPAGATDQNFRLGDGTKVSAQSPVTGVLYHWASTDEGTRGWTIGNRTSVALDDGSGNGIITRNSFGPWWILDDFEVFLEGILETWGKSVEGEVQTLFGGGLGLRKDVEGLPFELSGYYCRGGDGRYDWGTYFGLMLGS